MLSVQEIKSAIIGGNFASSDLDEIAQALLFARNQSTRKNVFVLRAGDRVRWNSPKNGRPMQGTVNKVGRKFVTVNTNQFGQWRVPAYMLELN